MQKMSLDLHLVMHAGSDLLESRLLIEKWKHSSIWLCASEDFELVLIAGRSDTAS
jgi:hypothetical protein